MNLGAWKNIVFLKKEDNRSNYASPSRNEERIVLIINIVVSLYRLELSLSWKNH